MDRIVGKSLKSGGLAKTDMFVWAEATVEEVKVLRISRHTKVKAPTRSIEDRPGELALPWPNLFLSIFDSIGMIGLYSHSIVLGGFELIS